MTIHHTDSLRPLAKSLRRQFELIQSDDHHPARFQWDWWHLPGRYTHLRTPAELYFSEQYQTLVESITGYAREEFGCSSISPIWLSNYVEGCEQRLHADRPHGPWAFVFSLTSKSAKFKGGETILLRDEILNFWQSSHSFEENGQSFEEDDILIKFPSKLGRLLVFDPRIPHGVSRVSGTVNPLEGRLVLHGWFSAPHPFVDGALPPQKVEPVLLRLDKEMETIGTLPSTGTVAYRISIQSNGSVSKIRRLRSSMKNSKPLDRFISNFFKTVRFSKSNGKSDLTLPFTIS
jgi:hypothetical protein